MLEADCINRSPLLRDTEMPPATGGTSRHEHSGDSLRPLHVCFVAPEAWPVLAGASELGIVGGAEVQQSMLARLLVRAGYRVSMICLDYGQAERAVIDGITVYRTCRPDAGAPGLRFLHPRLTSMWHALREADADIYYQRTASMLTAIVAAFCRQHERISVYAGASDPDFQPGRQEIRFRRDRWLFEQGLARVTRVVVQNATQKKLCLDNYFRHAVIIPSCYQLPQRAKPGSGQHVLWVGTIRRCKRPQIFLDLAERLPRLRFTLVGGPGGSAEDIALFDSICRRAVSLPNVELTGFLPLDQVEPHFDRAAVFVNTSAYEGVPTTFLQAWARGIPTVAFTDTGARLDGKSIYRVSDTPDTAAGEIERLFADEAYRQQAAKRCREYFAITHSPAGVLAKYEQLFAELAPRKPR